MPCDFSASLFSLCASVELRFVEQEDAETAEDSPAENRKRGKSLKGIFCLLCQSECPLIDQWQDAPGFTDSNSHLPAELRPIIFAVPAPISALPDLRALG